MWTEICYIHKVIIICDMGLKLYKSSFIDTFKSLIKDTNDKIIIITYIPIYS